MDCSVALRQNMNLASSSSHEKQKAGLQYTITLQSVYATRRKTKLQVSMLQKLANASPPESRRRVLLAELSSNVGIHRDHSD